VLVTQSAEQGADVLVVGNKGMQRRILGSVPNSVAHKADCSVMIVKDLVVPRGTDRPPETQRHCQRADRPSASTFRASFSGY
jgi:Universal stress protein family